MENQFSVRVQNSLLNNRVKILRACDYYTVSAPLIARRFLSLEKHKTIKNVAAGISDAKAANTARMDELLDFIDENPNPTVFEAFLDGIRNCESSKQFAKILKKEVEGSSTGLKLPDKPKIAKPKTQKPKVVGGVISPPIFSGPPPSLIGSQNGPLDSSGILSSSFLSSLSSGVISAPIGSSSGSAFTPIKVDKGGKKAKGVTKLSQIGLSLNGPTSTLIPPPSMQNDVFAFSLQPPPVTTPSKPRQRPPKKSFQKPLEGGPNTVSLHYESVVPIDVTVQPPNADPVKKDATKKSKKEKVAPAVKKVYPSKAKQKSQTKIVSAGPSLTEEGPEITTSSMKSFSTLVPAGSPFRPKSKAKFQPVSREMTFAEVEEKQKSATRVGSFTFLNPASVIKKINFNNKSDLFYEGCPTKEENYLCTKKVQLKGKGKKYVCKDKHENEAYELFPRLIVTFEDRTGELEATLFRENVEIIAGKSVSEMHVMNDTALNSEFSKAIGQNIPIRVACEKILKKDLKISGGKPWGNVAHIISEVQEGPPTKKAKKAN